MRASLTATVLPNAANMRRVVARTAYALAKEAVDRQRNDFAAKIIAPATVARPIQWESEKQRIKVMILLREANPAEPWYHRTGGLEQGWKFYAAQTPEGGTIILTNPLPQAKYVYGDFKGNHQQRFHSNSGWQSAEQIRRELFTQLLAIMHSLYVETLQAFGFFQSSKV